MDLCFMFLNKQHTVTAIKLYLYSILFQYLKLYARYKSYKLANDENYVPRKLNLIGQIALYLIPAIIVFIFIPAIFFTYFEDWDYSISVYYAFVTLTTIGFGDFVPTFQAHQVVYRKFCNRKQAGIGACHA